MEDLLMVVPVTDGVEIGVVEDCLIITGNMYSLLDTLIKTLEPILEELEEKEEEEVDYTHLYVNIKCCCI